MSTQITDVKYNSYYFALKRVYELHREYGFGKSPDIPSGFSEALCRCLIGVEKSNNRAHDAISPEGKAIEIKATGTIQGKTTISNSNEFDLLVWIFIEFEKDKAKIFSFQRDMFELSGATGRKSISLGSIAKSNNIDPDTYTFQQPSYHFGD